MKNRRAGNRARKQIRERTGQKFIGAPNLDRYDSNDRPVARNEYFQHMTHMGMEIVKRGGFIVEQAAVT